MEKHLQRLWMELVPLGANVSFGFLNGFQFEGSNDWIEAIQVCAENIRLTLSSNQPWFHNKEVCKMEAKVIKAYLLS